MTSRLLLVLLAVAILAVLAAKALGAEGDAGAVYALAPVCEPCPVCAVPASPAGPSLVPQGGNFELVVCILWLAVAAALKRASWAKSNSPEELVANLMARVPLLGQLLALWRTPPPSPPASPAAKS